MITRIDVEKQSRHYYIMRDYDEYMWLDEAQPGDLIRRELFEDDRGRSDIPVGLVISREDTVITVIWSGDASR